MKKEIIVCFLLVFAMFFLSAYFFPVLPEKIATHWDANGLPNGFSEKLFGVFLLPAISAIIVLLLFLVPIIDPLKKNIISFEKEYFGFILVFAFFFFCLHAFLIAFNLGAKTDIRLVIVPGISLLFAYLGYLMTKTKRNYFIGIRTPWTLASDSVWEKTHKLGSKAFFLLAILFLLSAFFPNQFVLLLLVPLILACVFLVAYSYLEFSKEEKEKLSKRSS